MNLYQILVKKESPPLSENNEAKISNFLIIKQSFSLPAFIFGFFWLIYHRLWKKSLIIISSTLIIIPFLSFLISLFVNNFSDNYDNIYAIEYIKITDIFIFFLNLYLAFNAKNWLISNLVNKRKFRKEGDVVATNQQHAEELALIMLCDNYPSQKRNIIEILLRNIK